MPTGRSAVEYRGLGGLFCAGLLLALSGSALAGDWKLSDSISTKVTAVDRSGDQSSSGLVGQLTPRVVLKGEGGRSKADIDYGITASVGGSDIDPESFTHDLNATAELEVVENFFTLGGRASADLVGKSATAGRADSINLNDDGRQSFSVEILPTFHRRLNRYANLVSNNSID